MGKKHHRASKTSKKGDSPKGSSPVSSSTLTQTEGQMHEVNRTTQNQTPKQSTNKYRNHKKAKITTKFHELDADDEEVFQVLNSTNNIEDSCQTEELVIQTSAEKECKNELPNVKSIEKKGNIRIKNHSHLQCTNSSSDYSASRDGTNRISTNCDSNLSVFEADSLNAEEDPSISRNRDNENGSLLSFQSQSLQQDQLKLSSLHHQHENIIVEKNEKTNRHTIPYPHEQQQIFKSLVSTGNHYDKSISSTNDVHQPIEKPKCFTFDGMKIRLNLNKTEGKDRVLMRSNPNTEKTRQGFVSRRQIRLKYQAEIEKLERENAKLKQGNETLQRRVEGHLGTIKSLELRVHQLHKDFSCAQEDLAEEQKRNQFLSEKHATLKRELNSQIALNEAIKTNSNSLVLSTNHDNDIQQNTFVNSNRYIIHQHVKSHDKSASTCQQASCMLETIKRKKVEGALQEQIKETEETLRKLKFREERNKELTSHLRKQVSDLQKRAVESENENRKLKIDLEHQDKQINFMKSQQQDIPGLNSLSKDRQMYAHFATLTSSFSQHRKSKVLESCSFNDDKENLKSNADIAIQNNADSKKIGNESTIGSNSSPKANISSSRPTADHHTNSEKEKIQAIASMRKALLANSKQIKQFKAEKQTMDRELKRCKRRIELHHSSMKNIKEENAILKEIISSSEHLSHSLENTSNSDGQNWTKSLKHPFTNNRKNYPGPEWDEYHHLLQEKSHNQHIRSPMRRVSTCKNTGDKDSILNFSSKEHSPTKSNNICGTKCTTNKQVESIKMSFEGIQDKIGKGNMEKEFREDSNHLDSASVCLKKGVTSISFALSANNDTKKIMLSPNTTLNESLNIDDLHSSSNRIPNDKLTSPVNVSQEIVYEEKVDEMKERDIYDEEIQYGSDSSTDDVNRNDDTGEESESNIQEDEFVEEEVHEYHPKQILEKAKIDSGNSNNIITSLSRLESRHHTGSHGSDASVRDTNYSSMNVQLNQEVEKVLSRARLEINRAPRIKVASSGDQVLRGTITMEQQQNELATEDKSTRSLDANQASLLNGTTNELVNNFATNNMTQQATKESQAPSVQTALKENSEKENPDESVEVSNDGELSSNIKSTNLNRRENPKQDDVYLLPPPLLDLGPESMRRLHALYRKTYNYKKALR